MRIFLTTILLLMSTKLVIADVIQPIKENPDFIRQTKSVVTKIDVKDLIKQRDFLQKQIDNLNKQLDDIGKVIDVKAVQKRMDAEKKAISTPALIISADVNAQPAKIGG